MSYGIQSMSRSGTGPWAIGQVMSQSLEEGFNIYKSGGSGRIYDSYATILEAMGLLSFTTLQLKQFLTNISTAGAAVAASTPLNVFFQKRDANGTYLVNANEHIQIAAAYIVPMRLEMAQNREATIEGAVHVLDAGANEPISHGTSTDANMTALLGTVPADECYTLGPVKVGSAFLENIQEVAIDFGIELHKPTGDGLVRPIAAHQRKVRPMVTIRGLTLSEARAYFSTPTSPATLTARLQAGGGDTDILLFARKKTAYGGNAAGTTAIKFTISRAFYEIDRISGEDAGDGSYSVRLSCLWDGTNHPIVPALDVAIA